jgi:two-component system, sensor histidine kinase ChiS
MVRALLAALLTLSLALSGCGARAVDDASVHGDVLDATGLTASSAPLRIVGPLPWWNELLDPASDPPGAAPGTVAFTDNSALIAPDSLAPDYPFGFGTTRFSLRVSCEAARAPAALRLGVVDAAMRLVVRERSSGAQVERSVGTFGEVRNTGRPERRRMVVPLPPPARCEDAAVYDVHFAFANQHVASLGPWAAPEVSSLAVAQANFAAEHGTSLFFMGSLSMVALYHLGLWFVRRRERAPLVMAAFALLLAFRVFTQRHVLGTLAPSLDSFWFIGPIEIFCIPLLSILFEQLLQEVVAPGVPQRVRVAYRYVQLALALAVVPCSIATIWSVVLPAIQIAAISLFLVSVGFLARKLVTTRDGDTAIVASGFVILGAALCLEALDQQRILTAPGVGGYAQLFLVFSQAFVLAKQNARARRQAEVLSDELGAKNRELEEAAKLRDDFVSNTSHELRTPVHGIVGLAESMAEDPSLPAAFAPRVQGVIASGLRLRGLVDALLDFAKRGADEQRFEKAPVDLAAVVEERAQALAVKLVGPEIVLRWSLAALPPIAADRARIERLVDALVGNAIKFTERGTITVSLARTPEGAELRIVDTGPGLPKTVRDHLFEPFVQGERSDTRVHGGAGLGLAAAKKIVSLHGGSIDLTSGDRSGTTAVVVLPIDAAQSVPCNERSGELRGEDAAASMPLSAPLSFGRIPGSAPGSAPLSASFPSGPVSATAAVAEAFGAVPAGGRILVVDDEPINREVLRQQLTAKGYEVAEAADGLQAVEALQQGLSPDLVLLDVMMPHMSGYEVLAEVRKTQPESALPIVLLTAKNREQDLIEGFERGASDYVTKPFSKAELLARVAHHLRLVITTRRLAEELFERQRLEGTVENLRTLRDRETRELARLRDESVRLESDVKLLREHLLQGEKLAGLGQLVAGVAHELNNPIGYIGQAQESLLEFFETLVRRIERGDDARALAGAKAEAASMLELAGFVGTGAQRLREISSALRNYARADRELMLGVRLDEVLEEALVILSKRLKMHQVDVEIGGVPELRCHRSHIGQVIVNFLSNAGDELDTVREQRGQSFEGRILVRAELETRGVPGVRISVEDSGRGVPPELATKIFETFFTTKPAGKGTGLGLAICTEIANEHEGELHVARSERLGGASFELWIPIDGPQRHPSESLSEAR